MYKNAQRSFNGGNEYYMEPFTLKKKNDEEDSLGDFSPGLLDLYSFDTELLPEELDLKNHKWGHYFICGYKGFYDYAKLKGVDVGQPVGLDVRVDGTVPTVAWLNYLYIACEILKYFIVIIQIYDKKILLELSFS